MKKTISVTGDWVADWNLARPENLPEGYFDGSLQTQLVHRAGGAWYVAHLIENVSCRDLKSPATDTLAVSCSRPVADCIQGLNSDGTQRDDIAHAYSVWWKQRQTNSGKKEDQVWRIARFAGCRKSTAWSPPVAVNVGPVPSLLVIDDLGLGFSEQPGAVAHVSSHTGDDSLILVKHGVRPDGSGILPQLLERKLGDRLHVVASANALRRRNAALSRALSWDKVLEDTEAEFKFGPCALDLARCATVVIHFGVAGAAVFKFGRLHRFCFLPEELEGVWEENRPGKSFGTGSVLTACMARHLIQPDDYPLFFAVTQALAAQRTAHHEGGGSQATLEIDLPYGQRAKPAVSERNPSAACVAPPRHKDPKDAKHIACIAPFRTAWNPADIPVWQPASAPGLRRNRLLCNVTGTTTESFRAKALEVVTQGPAKALASVPRASYERYLTVDRDEIESTNEIRRLILEYQTNAEDKRPLSIAVFGAPGSGKSFAVKEVAKAIFGKEKEPLEFNLTQIRTPEDLHKAFHQVRDASIRHEIPIVFWDEFDTGGLKWLADFLGPMQDAEFFDGSHKHPFGKCIFVFAGGTRSTFGEFKKWAILKDGETWEASDRQHWHQSFKDLKGPDFISRLRGFLDIKGPNPTPPVEGDGQHESTAKNLAGSFDAPRKKALPESEQVGVANDPAYVLRRALVLRNEIKRLHPHLIDPATDRAAIAPNVLHAFLSVTRYEHGARSITALLSMSALSGAKAFTVSCLPAEELLRLHVSADFRLKLIDPVWSDGLLLALARAGHEGYCSERIKTEPDAPEAKPWSELEENGRRNSHDPVPRRLLELQRLGWIARPKSGIDSCQVLTDAERGALLKEMVEPEHNIWLSNRLTEGFERATATRRWLRLNTDIAPFAEIPAGNKAINAAIITETLAAFETAGFCLVRDSERGTP